MSRRFAISHIRQAESLCEHVLLVYDFDHFLL